MAAVGEIIRAAVEYFVPNASTCLNIFYWLIDDNPIGDEELFGLLSDWVEDVWHPEWSDSAANIAKIIGLAASIINADGTVDREIGDTSFDLAGDVATLGEPAAVAPFMYAPTNRAKTRGRKFIPGWADGRMENGVVNATGLADLTSLAALYIDTLTDLVSGAVLIPGVVSTVTVDFHPFIGSASVTNVPAYQRRRKPGVGI